MNEEIKQYIDGCFNAWKADAVRFSRSNFESILQLQKEEIDQLRNQLNSKLVTLKNKSRETQRIINLIRAMGNLAESYKYSDE